VKVLDGQEIQVLRLVAEGWTTFQIAPKIGTTRRNVKAITSRIRLKLEARNITHAVSLAYQRGLLKDGIDGEQVELVRLAQGMGYRIALVPKDG
jgi:DNA-binding CsgD family transcriptional regulator